jgi:hypothetical protein
LRRRSYREPERGSKAAARRGSCSGCDRVPASDRSKERLHRYDDYIHEAADLYKIPEPLIRAVISTTLREAFVRRVA